MDASQSYDPAYRSDLTPVDIASYRLYNQQITSPKSEKPGEVVQWLGAVQAQDYLGSLWAIGLRLQNAAEADIERGIINRTIVRTWPMRGTLHFVAPADLRWMLELTTPRILAGNARRLERQYGLDDTVIARSKEVCIRVLQSGKQLTRSAMYQALEEASIPAANQRGLHILWWLAQEGLICFGAREGKQPTFVLLDEWVPYMKSLAREEALAVLAQRYFTSHGPATLQDFVWWSGLSTTDAQAGLELIKLRFAREVIAGQTYWLPASMPELKDTSPIATLLPAYDEYTVAYKDRSAVLSPSYAGRADSGNGIFNPTIVIDGQVVGTWKRSLKKGSVTITPNLFKSLNRIEKDALAAAASQYAPTLGCQLFRRRYLRTDLPLT